MTFNKIIHTPPDDVGIPYSRSRFIALTADLSALIGINLSREVRQEARRAVGARAADEGRGGPLWSPAGGEGIMFIQDVSQGNRTRATIKALPAQPNPARPYGI